MGKAVKRFLVRLALVAAMLGAAYAGWKWGDAVFPRVEEALGIAPTEPPDDAEPPEDRDPSEDAARPESRPGGGSPLAAESPEAPPETRVRAESPEGGGTVGPQAAETALKRIQAFRDSRAAELRLKPFEVSSLLRHSLTGVVPTGVLHPSVEFRGDRIEVTAGVLRSALPDLPGIGGIARILLPDTVPVFAAGTLAPFGDRGSMLVVSEIVVSGVSVPESAYPDILATVGRRDEEGLPESAMRLPAFEEIKGAYIEGGELVLVRA